MKNKKNKRIIPILDIKNGLVIKGINLEGLRILAHAESLASYYYNKGADEICYIDNVATLYGTNNLTKFVSRTAQNIFIPLSVGGGIRNISDIQKLFIAGADKVCINSAVIDDINFLNKAKKIFGSANITIIVQSICIDKKYYICKANGRDIVKINPLDWAKTLEDKGAGEIILTSVNKEGLRKGFDYKITSQVSNALEIPVIAHGGAGSFNDVYKIFKHTKISGVALASFLHYDAINYLEKPKTNIGNTNFISNFKKKNNKKNLIKELKEFLNSKGVNVRL